ncbi:MAG TPA: carboxymuconolactone decarboxylase family protein [Hyphomicrobiaceae bacterium]|nr:carboxymuconolactone decarboxylase family protein [Hyphomicrobiaceae bacterium]
MARVPLCTAEDLPEGYRDLFERTERSRSLPLSNLVRALAHIPLVLEHRTAYSNSLRQHTKLPRRDCELAILAVGHFTGCRYEFLHHVKPAIAAGLRREQIRALADFQTSPEFDERERAIVRYAYEATVNIKVSDDTWNAVASHLERNLLLELVLIVAWYNQTVRVVEPLQIDLEDRYRDMELP